MHTSRHSAWRLNKKQKLCWNTISASTLDGAHAGYRDAPNATTDHEAGLAQASKPEGFKPGMGTMTNCAQSNVVRSITYVFCERQHFLCTNYLGPAGSIGGGEISPRPFPCEECVWGECGDTSFLISD